jgi:hypothetical protein
MSAAKLAVVSGLAAVALAGCGAIQVKPSASAGSTVPASRGQIDDPRTNKHNHLACLVKAGLNVHKAGLTGLQIDSAPSGPAVTFAPTPGAAQADQIQGRIPGAEVIGSALVYPNGGSDGEMKTIENCMSQGVSG